MSPHTLHVWMESPIKVQNAGLFISRGDAMHPTRTIDSHELILVVQGELDMWEGDQVFRLVAGSTLHLWPGRTHGSTKPMPPDLRFYWIHFDVPEGRPERARREVDRRSAVDVPQHSHMPRPDALERLFRFFLTEQETGILRPSSANMLMLLMLFEVGQQALETAETATTNAVATWAHNYIRMNFDRGITAGKVAEALGYNLDYLGRIFRETYHCTLTEAIHRRRIQKACEYLLNSELTISQIAGRCGFRNPDYFRRIFRSAMQVTPGEYRQENLRVHIITH